MCIISFNVNGICFVVIKGFLDWFCVQDVDVLCIQEIKVQEDQLIDLMFCLDGYYCFYCDVIIKKGYSGVVIYSKCELDQVIILLGWVLFDDEGCYIEVCYGNFSVVLFYIFFGSLGDLCQGFKFEVMEWLCLILEEWVCSGCDYVLCGDWNIVCLVLDIKNWKFNQKNFGCLLEECDWFNVFCVDYGQVIDVVVGRGWVDVYCLFNFVGEDYIWWSNRGVVCVNNVGWCIDYQFIIFGLCDCLCSCLIYCDECFFDYVLFIVDYDL